MKAMIEITEIRPFRIGNCRLNTSWDELKNASVGQTWTETDLCGFDHEMRVLYIDKRGCLVTYTITRPTGNDRIVDSVNFIQYEFTD